MLPTKTAEELLSFDDRPYFEVECPKLGATIVCREPDVSTLSMIRASCRDGNGEARQDDFAIKMVIEGCFSKESEGVYKKLFSVGDYERLKSKGSAIQTLAFAILDGKKNDPLKS